MKLDFTLFGVARSGTTAFAQAINVSPNIFCGIEFFSPEDDHSVINVPDAFYDKSISEKKSAENINQLSKKTSPIKYGNKYPLYYRYLDDITRQLPNIRHIGIYREGLSYMKSWDSRVNLGVAWHKGRIGLLAPIEFVAFVKKMSDLECKNNVWITPFSRLFYGDSEIYRKVFRTLGVDCNDELLKTINKRFMNRRIENSNAIDERQIWANKFLEVKHFDTCVEENYEEPLSKWPIGLNEYAEFLSNNLIGYLEAIFDSLGEHSTQYLNAQKNLLVQISPKDKTKIDDLLISLNSNAR